MTAHTFAGKPRPPAARGTLTSGEDGVFYDEAGETFTSDQWAEARSHANGSDRTGSPPGLAVEPDSWQPVDLAPIVQGLLSGEIVGPRPSLMARSDGACLLYRGELHSISAEPESCKGWIVLSGVVHALDAGERALYLDFEDSPANIVSRLMLLGADPTAIVERFVLVRPETNGGVAAVLRSGPYALAVIDGVTEAMQLYGLKISDNDDIARFRKLLGRPIAVATGAAVVEIDHVVKSREDRGRYAIGGGHKLAGVAVAYSVQVTQRPSRTREGRVKLKIEKDRHGRVREHAAHGDVIALVRIVPDASKGCVTVTLDPPDNVGADGEFRPTRYMERVSRYLEQRQAPASKNVIERDVTGRAEYVRAAVEALVAEGHVSRDSNAYASIKPFREAGEEATSSPRPDLVPTSSGRPSSSTSSPRPPLLGGEDEDDARGQRCASSPSQPLNALTADITEDVA